MNPDEISIWSKEYKGRPPLPPKVPTPPKEEAPREAAMPQGFELPPGLQLPPGVTPEQFMQAMQMEQMRRMQMQQMQQAQRPPGKLKIAAIIGLQLVLAAGRLIGHALKRLFGLGMIVTGAVFNKLSGRKDGSKKKMSLKAVFLGAALAMGAMMAPGGYYMTQPNEIVRTRVTGKVEADTKAEFPGQKYIIHTSQGQRFDTYGIEGGKNIQEGCVYDFNVKSARIQIWPPGYTRSIQSYKPVDGGCKP